jgi:hypothetical protein
MYVSLLGPPEADKDCRDALHLSVFEQPAGRVFFSILLKIEV